MSGYIETTNNNVSSPILASENEWTNTQTFNDGLNVDSGTISLPPNSISATSIIGIANFAAPDLTAYSTTTQMNSAIAST